MHHTKLKTRSALLSTRFLSVAVPACFIVVIATWAAVAMDVRACCKITAGVALAAIAWLYLHSLIFREQSPADPDIVGPVAVQSLIVFVWAALLALAPQSIRWAKASTLVLQMVGVLNIAFWFSMVAIAIAARDARDGVTNESAETDPA